MTGKENRAQEVVHLRHGQPVVFGPNDSHGIRVNGLQLEVIELSDGRTADDCLVWDHTDGTLAYLMTQMLPPAFPTPIGILRSVERTPFETAVNAQVEATIAAKGKGNLEELLGSGDVWTVD